MSGSMRMIAGSALLSALLLTAACTSDPPRQEPSGDVAVLASGLDVPWSIAFVGDTTLVSERDSGRILELRPGADPRVVTTVEGVVAQGEGGLLGLAVRGDEMLYAYSTGSTGNRIQRFPVADGPDGIELGAPETVIEELPSSTNHNGGRIAFGPDGMLYATVGDAGHGDEAQSLDSLAGKILRLTPDGDVPDDNPFAGSAVYSLGHRNPQGIAWGPDGTLYASEFGQNTWDELNVITAGANYGWPEVEGIAGDDRYVDPVQQWAPSEASPSGIAVDATTIYLANLRGEMLRTVSLDDLAASAEHLEGEFGRIRDAVVTADGALWILTNNTDGRGEPGADDDQLLDVTALLR